MTAERQRTQPHRRRNRVAAGIAVAGLLLAIAGILCFPPTPALVVGPRGEVRLAGVSYGTNHFAPPRLWNQARSALPPRWRRILAPHGVPQAQTPDGDLVVWLRLRGDAEARDVHLNGPLLSVRDTRGFENALGSNPLYASDRDRGGRSWVAVSSSRYPRRVESFRWRMTGFDTNLFQPPAPEVRTPNRRREHVRTWEPEPLPARSESVGTEFVLRAVAVESDPARVGPPIATVRWAALRAGRAAHGWRMNAVRLADETGNIVALNRASESTSEGAFWPSTEVEGDGLTSQFPWRLWSDESAWRLELEFEPSDPEGLRETEWQELKGLRAPAVDEVVAVNAHLRLSDRAVRVLGLVGEHASLPGREHDVQGVTTVEVEAGFVDPGFELAVLQVVDQQGRRFPVVQRVGPGSFGFALPPDARTLDITVALYERRWTVFMIRPEFRTAAHAGNPLKRRSS